MDLVCLPFYIAKEKPLIGKTRFYAATFGKDYEHIIEKYEAGMEIDSFCQSVMLDDKDEINPIQMNTTDANFEFDNENAIVVNFKKKKEE